MRLLLATLVLILVLVACTKARTSCVYEIPEGFTGWVLIEFSKTNCTPLAKKEGKLVFQIGSDGRFCTSTALESGWAKDAYYYIGKSRTKIQSTGWGGGGMIWGGSTGSVQQPGNMEKTYANFFVGTEEQFKLAAGLPRPE